MPKWVVVASPKGGSGKTNLARNLAVAAALDGLRVVSVDLDRQRTLTNWVERRRAEMNEAIGFQHITATMEDVPAVFSRSEIAAADVMIVDTPPAVEEWPDQSRALVERADVLLIPTKPTIDDADSVAGLAKTARRLGRIPYFVMSLVKPRVASIEVKSALASRGEICPFEIHDRTDHHRVAQYGAALADMSKHPGGDEVRALWLFAKLKLDEFGNANT
jgi:chromosome partitioning protein